MNGRTMATVVWVALLAAAGEAIAQPTRAAKSDAEVVDDYLNGLGLDDLRLIHLERAVGRDPEAKGLARTLADLYASRLLATTDESAVENLNERIDALLASHPEASTPALQVMRLQADYNRAEALASKWVDDPEDTASRDAALALLEKITPELNEQQVKLFAELDKEREALDELPEGPEYDRREQALARTGEVAGRALYFDSWANYYLGLLRPGPDAGEHFRKAGAGFLKLLGVDKVADADAEMLASGGMARAALGAGLSAFGAGDEEAGRAWFALLRQESVNPELRDLADYWLTWALLNAGKTSALNERIRALGEGFGARATPGREALAALLVRAGYGPKADEALQSAGMLGLRALARMKRFERVRQLIEKYGIPTEDREEIVFRWVRAQGRLEAAGKADDPKGFAEAARLFQEALAAPDASTAPGLAASCRFLLAWSRYQAGDFAAAADEFRGAASALQALRDPEAPDAFWMHAVALERLAAYDKARVTEAIEALKAFARDYPEHPKAKLVEFEVQRLGGEAVTVEQAEATPLTDPTYASVSLSAIRHHHDRWRKEVVAGRSGDEERAKFGRALAAFRKLPESVREPSGTLEALLLEADLALSSDATSAEVGAILDRAGSVAGSLSPDDRLVAQYHAARLRRAQAIGDATAIRAEAEWLGTHAGGTPTELAALISLARLADQALKDAPEAERSRRLSEARDAYGRLARSLGTTPEAIGASRNALVANARLAEYLDALGAHREAAERYDAILGAYPKDANYLRRAGLAHFRADEFAEALDSWQTLLAGLPAGSERWIEAKYYQLSSLARTDQNAAKEAYRQFRVLYPMLGGATWRPRFEALGRGLPTQ